MADRIDLGPMGCIRCGEAGRLYAWDARSGGWLRHECQNGHFGDFGPDSVYIPELIRRKLRAMGLLVQRGSVRA